MLSKSLLPIDQYSSTHHPSEREHCAIPIPQQPSSSNDWEYVRPPDAYIEVVLLPPAHLLEPQLSAASDVGQAPAEPSLFRRLFAWFLLVYLSMLSAACFVVVSFAQRAGCSHSLVIYLGSNGTVSGLLALLTLYAARSVPVDLSQLAVAAERSELIRWLTVTCLKKLLSMADFVFLIIGHIAFFSSGSSDCAARSPLLHGLALASIISGYVGFVVPLLTFLYLTLSTSSSDRDSHRLSDSDRHTHMRSRRVRDRSGRRQQQRMRL